MLGTDTTTDPMLHGPWTLADDRFATTSAGIPLSAGANPDFYALPGPVLAGEPTHLIDAGRGGSFRLCWYDTAAAALRNCTEEVYDVGPGDWTAVGQAHSSGAVLQSGWIRCSANGPFSCCLIQLTQCALVCAPMASFESHLSLSLCLSGSPAASLANHRPRSME